MRKFYVYVKQEREIGEIRKGDLFSMEDPPGVDPDLKINPTFIFMASDDALPLPGGPGQPTFRIAAHQMQPVDSAGRRV